MDSTQLQETLTTSLREVLGEFSKTMCPPIASVRVSEFTGDKSQDVGEWLDSIEQETLAFSEDQRKAILKCAFTKAARAWFKCHLEPKLDSLDWQGVKIEIFRRYKPDRIDSYVKKLNELNYQQEDELGSYVDQRVYLMGKAYPTLTEAQIIRDCVTSLPPNVRSYLNLMSDTSSIKKLDEFNKLVSRYDRKIDMGITQPSGSSLNKELFESLLQKAVESVVDKMTKIESQVAAIAKVNKPMNTFDDSKEPQRQQYRNSTPPYQNNNRWSQNQQSNQRNYMASQQRYNFGRRQGPQGRQQGYTSRGSQEPRLPPSPCYTCGDNHWNADCPQIHLNGRGC